MNYVLGVLTHRACIETSDSIVADHKKYYRRIWDALISGPEIVRPKRCGNTEPLKLVADADIDSVTSSDFITSNGRRCTGLVDRPIFRDSQLYSAKVLLTVRKEDTETVDTVFNWLKEVAPYRYAYCLAVTQELFDNHLEFHQRMQFGVAEVNLEYALSNKHMFTRFDVRTVPKAKG